ncbi:hypothetical protein GF351_00440 [Candidatus Woesearchaeota archaeon]|nr:hypothetical protein [Candidatus Woesearchaeota archaeon]
MKKAQVTLFIILGLVILIIFGVFAYLLSAVQENQVGPEPEKPAEELDMTHIRDHVDACIYATIKQGVGRVGLYSEDLELYLEENLPACIDFSTFDSKGFMIQDKDIDADIDVLDKEIVTGVEYPLEIRRGQESGSLRKFEVSFPLTADQKLDLDAEGKVVRSVSFYSTTEDSFVTVKKGTRITSPQGRPVDEISLKLIGIYTGNSTDRVGHKLLPVGSVAEPGVSLTVRYDGEMVDPEGDTYLAYFDEHMAIWRFIETETDQINDRVYAEIRRFRAFDLQHIRFACDEDSPWNNATNWHYHADSTNYITPFWKQGQEFCQSIGGSDCSGKGCLISFSFPKMAGAGTAASCCPENMCIDETRRCSELGGIPCQGICHDGEFVQSNDYGNNCCKEGFCMPTPKPRALSSGMVLSTDVGCPDGCMVIDDSYPAGFCTLGRQLMADSDTYAGTELYCSKMESLGYGRIPDQRAVWEIGKYDLEPGIYRVYVSFDSNKYRPTNQARYVVLHKDQTDIYDISQYWITDPGPLPYIDPEDGILKYGPVPARFMCAELGDIEFDSSPSEMIIGDPRDAHSSGAYVVDAVFLCAPEERGMTTDVSIRGCGEAEDLRMPAEGKEKPAEISFEGDKLTYTRSVQHHCCRNVALGARIDQGYLNITEIWAGPGCSDCQCFTELELVAENIPPGNYNVYAWKRGISATQQQDVAMTPELLQSGELVVS